MSQPILQVESLHAAYGPIEALHGVSVYVEKGEIVTIIGSNGAGKSTFLMTLFGQPKLSSGKIYLKGNDISEVSPHAIAKRGMALVPEGRRIFPGMTVEENLVLGAISLEDEPDQKLLDDILKMFPILEKRKHQRAGTLSGGEQQMLAIGRGLMAKPDILLLDEPSLGLAPIIVKQIFASLKDIQSQGTTVLLVEQNANHALKLADRGYVLVNGRITLEGSGDELLANADIQDAYLGGH